MSASSPIDDVQPGERIGRYTVLRRLGSGGMAEVYLARHEGPKNFSKVVVIKQVLPKLVKNEKFIQMFLDEGRLAARLSHPNIAQTFEMGEDDGRFHIAMEYVAGESLAKVIKRAKRGGAAVPPGVVLRVAVQLLEALDYTHGLKGERGEWLKVVHRDVSPTNVVLTYHGGVKLLDFGIARAASHEHHTQVGTVKGKGGYMAPEQARAHRVDQRADIYAVGALLYLLVTGIGPFDDAGDVFAMMKAAVESRFLRPSERTRGVNPMLEQIILKAMAGRADDRYPTARLMLADLEACANAQRLFAGARELSEFMRALFGERAELAHTWEQAPDERMIDKLAESFSDEDELVAEPTTRGRPPKVEEPPPAPSKPPAAQPVALVRPPPLKLSLSDERTPAASVPVAALKAAFDDDDKATEMVSTRFISRAAPPPPPPPQITADSLTEPKVSQVQAESSPTLPPQEADSAEESDSAHLMLVVGAAGAAALVAIALYWALG